MIRFQSGAIPYRRTHSGELEVLLITSRRRGRWVLPKGKVKRGALPHISAAEEAFEEAGVLGAVTRLPIATYRQRKFTESGQSTEIAVRAFPMFINTQLRTWPEMSARRRRWMSLNEAKEAVRDAELRGVLQLFGEEYADGDPL